MGGAGGERSIAVILLNNGADGLEASGTMVVTAQGQSLKTTPSSAEVMSFSEVNRTGKRSATVDYTLPSGMESEINVGVTNQGVLIIDVSASLRESNDERHIILLGVTIVKKRLGHQDECHEGSVNRGAVSSPKN